MLWIVELGGGSDGGFRSEVVLIITNNNIINGGKSVQQLSSDCYIQPQRSNDRPLCSVNFVSLFLSVL